MKAYEERLAPDPDSSFLWRERVDHRFGFAWHYHVACELTLITASRGRRFVGDSIEDYGPGDLVLLGRNLPHTWHSETARPRRDDSHRAIFVQFDESCLGQGFFERPELAAVHRLLIRARQGLRVSGGVRRDVATRLRDLGARTGMARLLGFLEILDRLAQARLLHTLCSKRYDPAMKLGDEQRIDRVCGYIARRFREDLSQPDAARVAHLSVPAFSRFFKRATGKTFTEYVNQLRIGYACRQLIESDRSVADIAFASGFNNLANFNRRFRIQKGHSPRFFRKQFRGEGSALKSEI